MAYDYEAQVTLEDCEEAVRKSSSHCAIASAIEKEINGAKYISVDIQTIRFSKDGAHHQTCKAASLDSLMGEVKHRLGFEDREAVRLQTLAESFKALPAPRTFDDDDMFVETPKRFGEF